MGLEFTLALSVAQLASAAGDLQRVISCLEQLTSMKLYVVEGTPTRKNYAFALPLRKKWPEDFSIEVDAKGWYVCFHSVTNSQQLTILQILTECLHRLGVTGTFKEL